MADLLPAPVGLSLVAADDLRVAEDGCVLVGGSPPRLLRLSTAGAERVTQWFAGEPVGEGAGERRLARRLLDTGMAHPRPAGPVEGAVAVVTPVRDERDVARVAARIAEGRTAIVVDDGSAEPVASCPGVDVVRRSVSGGPGVARNDGLRRAAESGAAFVAFIDADVDPPPRWIDDLLVHFDDPAVAAVAPRVRPAVGTSNLERYEMTFPSLDLGAVPAAVRPGSAVAYVPSAALLVRVSAFEQVGGFDATLRFGEDVDLTWRLIDAGHTVRYEPAVEVRHRARSDWGAWLRQRRDYGSSAAPLAARHGDAVAPARAPLGVYGSLAAALLAPLPAAGAVAASEMVAAQRRVQASLGAHHDPALVRGGLVAAVRSCVAALLRAGLPLTALLLLGTRRSRRRTLAILTAGAVAEVAESPRALGWVRAVALRLLDHSAYGWGVWTGLRSTGLTGLDAVRPVLSHRGVRAESTATDTVAP